MSVTGGYYLLALMSAFAGMMMRHRVVSWVSLFLTLGMIANLSRGDGRWGNVFSAASLSVVGLVMQYFTPMPPGTVSPAST